jgi:hypothetical protein
MVGPFMLYMGALIAPKETTCTKEGLLKLNLRLFSR